MQELDNKTQNERFADILSSLKDDITADDRIAAQEELKCSPFTISRYLNGKVGDNDLAVSLITFFKNRIAKRDKAVA